MEIVDVEDISGRPSSGGQTDKYRSVPGEVTTPMLPARIEPYHDPARDRIASAQIARFPKIAFMAGPSLVFGDITTVVFFGNDVFDVKGE